MASIIKIKKAKTARGMSYTDGMVSNRLDFRSARTERLLLDSGAQVNIVGEAIARDAKVKIVKLQKERFVTEASGNKLNIIGVCELFIKLPCLKTAKKIECLVLRGSAVDREILISCETLLKWDLIHSSFGQETITDFCLRNSTHYNRNLKRSKIKNVSVSQLYNKSKVSTEKLLERIPAECVQLKQKILKLHKKNFKEKLGKLDRIKCDPVQLKIDTSREIKPKKNTHCYDIPLHLKEAAREEFNEMLNSGIVVPADGEPTEWASLAFPRRKPNSYPPKCRWVADFRDLNRALDRPVWGGRKQSNFSDTRTLQPNSSIAS